MWKRISVFLGISYTYKCMKESTKIFGTEIKKIQHTSLSKYKTKNKQNLQKDKKMTS